MDKYRENSQRVIAAPYVCDFDGTTALILELPGTSHTLPAADKVKQAEALGNRVCVARNIAARLGGCQFLPEPRVTALGQPHLAGSVVPNCDTILDSVSMGVDDTEVVSNSAGGKLGDGANNDFIFERALVFIQPQYGRWTERHTFRGDVDFTVPPGHIGFVVARNPVMQDTGEFVIQIGNSHFYVRDLSFNSPDVAGKPEYTTTTQPMTPEQREQACKSGRPRKAPASFASIKRRGTGTGDALFGGRESTVMQALGGNDILRGEAGNDRLHGGSGRDALFGGSGIDSLRGRSGNDALDGGRAKTASTAGSAPTRSSTPADGRSCGPVAPPDPVPIRSTSATARATTPSSAALAEPS